MSEHESESEDGDAAFRWDAEKKCLVSLTKEEKEKQAEQNELQEETTESEEETEEDDVCVDMASTPELLRKAQRIGGSMLEQLADKWVVDKATGLSFLLNVDENRIFCWNAELQYFYEWKGRGKLEFMQVGYPQTSVVPSTVTAGSAEASSSRAVPSSAVPSDSTRPALFVTVVPPHILRLDTTVERRVERSKNLDRVEQECPSFLEKISAQTKVEIKVSDDGHAWIVKGAAISVTDAMSLIDQSCVKVHGAAKAEKMRKLRDQQHVEWIRSQSVEDAAKNAIPGMGAWAASWELPPKSIRRLKKCDTQLQRFVLRHFAPTKAKPKNALQAFIDRLQKPPQAWRLEAVVKDGHIDTECDSYIVDEDGKVAGTAGAIQLEGGDVKKCGDVDEEHVRLFPMGKDWYAMALEARIGAIVDGVKLRKQDGPHPIVDGSVVMVGKYLLLCEVGDAQTLQRRRLDLLETTTTALKDCEDEAIRLDEADRKAEEARKAEEEALKELEEELDLSPGARKRAREDSDDSDSDRENKVRFDISGQTIYRKEE